MFVITGSDCGAILGADLNVCDYRKWMRRHLGGGPPCLCLPEVALPAPGSPGADGDGGAVVHPEPVTGGRHVGPARVRPVVLHRVRSARGDERGAERRDAARDGDGGQRGAALGEPRDAVLEAGGVRGRPGVRPLLQLRAEERPRVRPHRLRGEDQLRRLQTGRVQELPLGRAGVAAVLALRGLHDGGCGRLLRVGGLEAAGAGPQGAGEGEETNRVHLTEHHGTGMDRRNWRH